MSFIAYEGKEFTIEWYFDEKGYSQALEYYDEQPKEKQRKLLNLFRLMAEQGKIFDETKFRSEDDGIYAFKPQPDRYLCFFSLEARKSLLQMLLSRKRQSFRIGKKRWL